MPVPGGLAPRTLLRYLEENPIRKRKDPMPYSVYPLGPLETNSYLVYKDGQAVVIDAGGDPAPILHDLRAKGLTLAAICLTHRHFDHMYGVATLVKETGAPVYSPVHDACLIGTESSDGGIWGFPPVPAFESRDLPTGPQAFGGMACTVLDTPGHTPGGVSYYFPDEKAVFTGDALFYRSLGRTDFPGGDHDTLLHSIRKVLFALPEETAVLPGHGPATSIGNERRNNPFCGDFV